MREKNKPELGIDVMLSNLLAAFQIFDSQINNQSVVLLFPSAEMP